MHEGLSEDEHPDCILLDLKMSDLSGLEIQQQLSEEHAPIVFVSGAGTISKSVNAMKSGAFDFLEKPVDADELLRVVQKALNLNAAQRQRQKTIRSVERNRARLTPREDEVMRHVITGRLNKIIADSLGITEKTIKVHRARVLQKMAVRSVAELSRLCEVAGIKPSGSAVEYAA
jgi:FixJ family two-component response regulator